MSSIAVDIKKPKKKKKITSRATGVPFLISNSINFTLKFYKFYLKNKNKKEQYIVYITKIIYSDYKYIS